MPQLSITNKVNKRISDSIDFVSKRSQLSQGLALCKGELTSFEEKGIEAGILRNFQCKVMDSAEGRDFIKTNNYGPFLPELLPIIIAWYPNFPLKELICVQDMDQDLAYIVTSELLTATNKAPTLAGQAVETPNGIRNIKGSYPSGEIMGEQITTDDLQVEGTETLAALVYYPLVFDPDNLEQTRLEINFSNAGVKECKAVSAVGGVITLENEDLVAHKITVKIEAKSGVITIDIPAEKADTFGTVTAIDASYVWNIEYATDENIPSVVEDMKMVPMIAKPRVIAMKWTIFSELVKKKQFGTDVRTETTKRVLDLMYQYLVRYILDRMYKYAEGGQVTISGPTTTIIDPNFKAQEILRQLNEASMVVANNTGRIEGNRIVVGSQFKNYLEALPENWYKPFEENQDYGFQGPRKIGQFSKYLVYYDNELPANAGFMTYRGAKWYDGSYYLGVFMPLVPTDAINININVRQAFCDMVAHRFDKPKGVVRLVFGANV